MIWRFGLWTAGRLDSGLLDTGTLDAWTQEILSIFSALYFLIIIESIIFQHFELMYYGYVERAANGYYNSNVLRLLL